MVDGINTATYWILLIVKFKTHKTQTNMQYNNNTVFLHPRGLNLERSFSFSLVIFLIILRNVIKAKVKIVA